MNTNALIEDIIKLADEKVKTSVPTHDILSARKVAIDCKVKLESLLADINGKIKDLNGESDPDVNFLTSKDAFYKAYNELKNTRKHLNLV